MYKIKQPKLFFRSTSRANLYREHNYCINYLIDLKNVLYNINEEALFYLKREIAECIFELGMTLERLVQYFKRLVRDSFRNRRNFDNKVKCWRADNKFMLLELFFWMNSIIFENYDA